MIRRAAFGDIPRLVELVHEMHGLSRYAGASIDDKHLRAVFFQSIQKQGGLAIVMVAEREGVVEGFIVGVLNRLYDIMEQFEASDWMYYASERAAPRDASRLLDAVIAWADADPRVTVQRYAVTDAISDFRRTGKLFERRGFRQAGAVFERIRGDGE